MRFINALAKFAHHWRTSGRANDRARLVLWVFRCSTSILIGPPGRTVGKGFPRRATTVAKGLPHDLQRRPSGGKKCRRKIRKSVPLLNRPGPSGNSWRIYAAPIYSAAWRGTRAITWNALVSTRRAGQLAFFFRWPKHALNFNHVGSPLPSERAAWLW